MSDVRTLGVEEELHVVDLETGRLTARAPQLLRSLPAEGFSVELQRSTVETNTPVRISLSDLRAEIVRLRATLGELAWQHGLGVAAVGTAPMSQSEDFELTALGRFSRMQQDYRVLVDDQLICGLQVHVGIDDRDQAVRVVQRVSRDLPTLLALSASSPFWHGKDTGYASFRTMIWQRWPSAGSAGPLECAADYDRLVADLIGSGVISDAKMAYFDVRPSAHVPTVELRVCDACPLVDDAVLIAGLFRALVVEAIAADERGEPIPVRREPLHRAAMWRAARSGLNGALLDGAVVPVPQPAAAVVLGLIARLREPLEASDDWVTVRELAEATLTRGGSSHRQRRLLGERGRMSDVVAMVVSETRGVSVAPSPQPELTAKYPSAPDDEAVGTAGTPVRAYQAVFRILDGIGAEELERRADLARERSVRDGFTFGVGGEQRTFPADLVPRIIPAHEWSVLAAGLTQRARAIELFLRDIYGRAEIVSDGVLDLRTVQACPGWRPEARMLPRDVVRAPIVGFDLVRDAVGGWRVLEDNARVPSGVGYAVGIRRIMSQVLPELAGGARIRDPHTTFALIGATLRACSPRQDPVVALLSDGADNSAWYEHRMIATEAGLLLVQPGEVELDGELVRVGGRRVDVLYLRLGVELADLHDTSGRLVGARILEIAQQGGVVLANAPGAGVADDKAMYCLFPDLIGYYLAERPLLSPVPTYRCADPQERGPVLERLGELVTKPVDGYGGGGVLIGPHASEAELVSRRAEILADPGAWIAQETVALSTHPTLADGALEPRHVDLRAFVYLSGPQPGSARLADLALTRVAPAGSMVVNSSRGGGAKDTWIIADPANEIR